MSCVIKQFVPYALEIFGLAENYLTSDILYYSATNIKRSPALIVYSTHVEIIGACGLQ